MDKTQALPSYWSDQDNFWLGKTYDKVRPLSSLKPVPVLPPSKGDGDSKWSEHLHPHITGLSLLCKLPPPNLLQVGPKVSGPTQPRNQVTTPENRKDHNNIGLGITKIAAILKKAFATLD